MSFPETSLATIDTPAVLVDLDIARSNIARFQAYADAHGIAVRPHIKTHKLPAIAEMQLAAGAIGITCQKVSEAEAMIAGSDAIRDVLAGAADAGSGTELATIDANLSGARQALEPLHDILASRYPGLPATQQSIATAQTLVEGFRGADGTWTRLSALTTSQRERVDAALSETAELLAPVAAICDPRRDP